MTTGYHTEEQRSRPFVPGLRKLRAPGWKHVQSIPLAEPCFQTFQPKAVCLRVSVCVYVCAPAPRPVCVYV